MHPLLRRCVVSVAAVLLCGVSLAQAEMKIGVNAHRGTQEVFDRWGTLSQYISKEVGDSVTLVPMKVYDVMAGAKKHDIDFMLTATVQTAQLQERYGAIPIGSVNTKTGAQYAGLIIARQDSGLQQASDLKGKKIAGLAKTASSGYIFQTYHLLQKGINVHTDCTFQQVQKQEDVVTMVKNRAADAGFVRAGVLEDMVAEGKADLKDFVAVDGRTNNKYPFLHSTTMYPDWYISAMPGVEPSVAERVTQALLRLPATSDAATTADITGFIEPLPLNVVHEALQAIRELQTDPKQVNLSPK